MRRLPSKRAAQRCLDERRVQRVLLRGGMLLTLGGQWIAFRCGDARRMQVGIVPDALAAQLEADGRAVRTQGEPLRLIAGASLEA